MPSPQDYVERVYAGILGKLIGVYLGRPFEGWEHERIVAELGEITGYVNTQLGMPIVVTDDDISGTFTFVRALEDYGYTPSLTAAQIGQSWLNYLVEGRTILSWAGLGCSTEHTAYLRLKKGIQAPASGSIAMNGPIVAQQIGAQIFIDSWAMLAPGNPRLAADLAGRAASVSHDGEAVIGAQALAAMEAQAFVERDRFKLLDTALEFTPAGSAMRRLIRELRTFHAGEPDWRKARAFIVAEFGNEKYPGGCHIIPNHALILLGLLYGDDDFQKSLMITNTSGWDTDCNSGNLGCLLGIKNGLAGIDASPVDWRGPVADRLFLPTADGGRAVTDAVRETYFLVNAALAMEGAPPLAPKEGARFHFELPGSVQGFRAESDGQTVAASVENCCGHSRKGKRSLAIRVPALDAGQVARVVTSTFIPPDSIAMPGYGLLAAPTLYAGQRLVASFKADEANGQAVGVQLILGIYGIDDAPRQVAGPSVQVAPGAWQTLEWQIPATDQLPIFAVGLQLDTAGTIYLDFLTWDGEPDLSFGQPPGTRSRLWRKAWVNGVDHWEWWSEEPFRLVNDEGRGMIITGTREWRNYRFSAVIRPAYLVNAGGIAVRVQGMQRYYALEIGRERLRLVKALDGMTTLAEMPFQYALWQPVGLSLQVEDQAPDSAGGAPAAHLRAWVDGTLVFDVVDADRPFAGGGVAILVDEGHILAGEVAVRPIL
jgi:ADP-ribosylglycohydrolase